MDRTKKTISYSSKRKGLPDFSYHESPNPSQEHISTSHSEASLVISSDSFGKSDTPADISKFFPNSKASSKKLQQQIAKSRPEDLSKIIEIISPRAHELMVDLYGNYMCQTLFHNCSVHQRLHLLRAMRGHLLSVAFHSRGTHSLQNLISMSSLKEEENIYKEEFQGKFIEMSKDINASHVVQRLLVSLSNRYVIIKEFIGRVEELANDKLGVCVLKKCCNDPEVMNEILANCLVLIQHPYGNYAVQSIIEYWKEEIGYEFSCSIAGRVLQLSLQKYSSNVIEKAIKIDHIRDCIIKELLVSEKIEELISNQYGCYVLRTLSRESNDKVRGEILALFRAAQTRVHSQKLIPLWQEITSILT